ncbi:hypothetical protein [Clostridium sp. Cult2]|uniref:hypothetical protein n=1 Tax=Clostridium sp. Cult2 TaxID=2079003 RepID=UPI001F1BAE2C|nr:hypothetical protein [Clostridium sp. Cult2]MCF6466099.1 hypothetical protein [Clostridium sp. Cult2]
MTKVNWSLIVGTIIILLLLFTMIYEDSIITADPYSLDRDLEYIINRDVLKAEHPVKPNPLDQLGTDPLGRNLFSLLIKGTKITLGIAFISTIIRLAIGVVILLIIKDRKKTYNKIFYGFSMILNILVGYIILSQPYFNRLELNYSVVAFSIVLGILGWERVNSFLNSSSEIFTDKDNGKVKFSFKEKIPHILILFLKEIGITLFILCILGFLGITIGVNKYSTIETRWGVIPNYNPEWGGILATTKEAINLEAYWLVVWPIIFFVIGILGFLLTARGLSYNIKNYGSIVSKGMKKIGNFISPKQYIEDIKRFSWNKSKVIVKSIIIVLIILWISPSIDASNGYYQINGERAWKDLDNISSIETKEKTAEYIAKELEKIDRLLPVFDDEYVQEIAYQQENTETGEKELVEGKNIAAYIWGRNSNNPLVIVTNYGNELYKNGTSVAATLELARSLSEKNNQQMASRTIVFLFLDGSLKEGVGVYNVLGSKNIDINSFYIYLNYLGLEDSDQLYMDTSSVFSAYRRHYRNIKNIKERAKELKIPIKQEYFDNMFEDVNVFMENKVSGLAISGIGKDEYIELMNQNQNDINSINNNRLEEQIQFIMNIASKYAWSDKPWLGDSY